MSENIEDMTPERVREIRKRSGLSQERFWLNIGFSLQQGSSFERGRFNQNNMHLKQAVFMRYVLDIPVLDSDALRKLKDMAVFGESASKAIQRESRPLEQTL